MSRKKFIESQGATCRNWTWSWSFIKENEKFVIFGAWKHYEESDRVLILGETWDRRWPGGIKNKAFSQSREHVRLVESGGYRLFTFTMYLRDAEGNGPARIDHFDRVLTQKSLRREPGGWYAYIPEVPLPEEIQDPSRYLEGASKSVVVNAYERSREARDKCIAVYGAICTVCGFNFQERYGSEAKGLIHVHHLVPLSEIREQYELDPVKDLRPVCPNCHAVIHYGKKVLSIEEVKARMHRVRGA